jgi:rRNA maturation endonuclease Nob1
MTKDEALKLALEALEQTCGNRCNSEYNPCYARTAITAIKEALAQPAQKLMHPELRKMWEDYFDKCFRAMPLPEPRNFCPRCGKRTPNTTDIHTCTPPRGLEMT